MHGSSVDSMTSANPIKLYGQGRLNEIHVDIRRCHCH